MHRRLVLSSGLAVLGVGALSSAARAELTGGAEPSPNYGPSPNYRPSATTTDSYPPPPPPPSSSAPYGSSAPSGYGQQGVAEAMTPPVETYSTDELVHQVSDFFGVTAEKAGALIEHIFRQNGRPTGYIAGQEGAAAFAVGLRYGQGLLYMKHRPNLPVFWQGPSVGWDLGGNASRVFTLCYNLQFPDMIFRRYPGVEGSAYVIGGMGVNYQRAEDVTLAPIRAGVGLRLGANIGYLSYSRKRRFFPL